MNIAQPQYDSPTLTQRAEQHLAVVRDTVQLDAIPALYDRAFPLIFAALEAAGTAPSGAPYGVVHGAPGDTLDLSVAVPVDAPVAPSGEVQAETLPAGTVATLLVRGDYSGLADAYAFLFEWLAEAGHTPLGLAWEQYLTEPEPGGDPALNETLLGVHLA
ncbi:GyrI-like domain-containing protein [Leucobacter chromiireducens]|uniref:GyrI-like domain-containing protein n=1 Tax=Leucobacter chromiireducens TaxID=283877 RepID=UPI000F63D7C7|nr:GyrI-like domain-containing protein [Leucobacter chromiireducens]